MPAGLVIAFAVLFVLILLAVSVGLKFFDARRRKQVGKMLSTAAGEPVVTVTNLLKELAPEDGSGFRGALERFKFTRHAQEQIQQAGMNWSPTRMMSAMALMAIPGLVIGMAAPVMLDGPLTAILLGTAFASAPYLYVRRKRKQRIDLLEEQFPESLDFLARSMRAGHAFSISLGMLGEEMPDPLGQEYRTLFNEHNLGAPLDVALRNYAERVPLLDVRFFTSSVLLQKQTGGNLSEILGRLAYVIRERFRLKGQVKAASAHGRMTATILTLLPVGTVAMLMVVAPGYLQGMAADSTGKELIAGAIGAQLLGNFFIKKIINIKV
ncbi:MAG: type II secretion system F family protein [Bryobacteraceae bacterium]|jgi:tight adherence protein B